MVQPFVERFWGVAWGGNLTVEVGDLGAGLASQMHGLGFFSEVCAAESKHSLQGAGKKTNLHLLPFHVPESPPGRQASSTRLPSSVLPLPSSS